jgi:lipoate-protein ligase B
MTENAHAISYNQKPEGDIPRRTMHDGPGKGWLCIELASTDYREAWDLQSSLVAARKDKRLATNLVLLLEHPPVFTLGRRGGMNNLAVSEKFLKEAGVQVIQVERGGDITYHGPGQLVMYPVVDLRTLNLTVADYVENLEEVMIRAAATWGIKAERNSLNRGVWVGNNKLGSVGIAIRRGICFHGIALNVNVSLQPFSWINPCGLEDVGITSMEQELGRNVPMNQVREAVKGHVASVFGIELVASTLSELEGLC